MIQNTLNWYNGELFESKFIFGTGVVLIVIALLFYYLGTTQGAKALLIPLVALGLLFGVIGASGYIGNSKRIVVAQEQYQENPKAFQQAEIKRVEGFMYLYPMSVTISLVCFLIAVGLLYFVKNIHWQAVAMALIILGSGFAVIDYFSKERALHYYETLKSN
ncbi:hypothetical protein RCZ04_05700 [Capnocytophaga sp. HP1101]